MKTDGAKIMMRLIGLVKPLRGYMFLAVLMGVAGHLCAAFLTVFGGFAVLRVLNPDGIGDLRLLFGVIVLFAVLRGLLRYAEQACNHFIAFKLLALIRDRVFASLRRLCPAKLEGRDRGELISIITADIELLEVFYAHTISPVCIAAVFAAVMSMFIGSYHSGLGFLALGAYVCVGMVIPLFTSRIFGENGMRLRQKTGELSGFVLDSLRGLSETLQYGQETHRLDQIRKKTQELSAEEERMKRIAGWSSAVTGAVILLFDLAMLIIAVHVCGFSAALTVTLALMSSFGPFVSLSALGSTLQNTLAAGRRVLDILSESPVVEEICGQPSAEFHGAAAEHISFTYGEEKILDDLSVDIPKGQITGISGRSGSGKSTLLRLLMRFWSVQQGTVRISGRNIEKINTSDLRGMESFVTQETHLFHDSIRNNLRVAKLDATEEEMISACKKASVHDFIMGLPKGYDTPVGELGDTLSGGERQRIGLARAFLHNAPFLLLDEPTSNLDSLNEAVVLKSLHEERRGRTIILVSHRKSTMGIADRVYCVESGRMS
ncbi:thiol reductant ABC exporter subunit CydC [Parablautia sp. Marseille-Q6255]|uniref:thiol reductant ABC exporter subunit CydC n=1 Tax=Parablautia sp. Marseille-Q6255 TaxID=3039593 RepID=UPI0024BCBB34|nr:thiol reductant ABC exporter subunit CydC [Parablautia sp. Marseille-Q6255]